MWCQFFSSQPIFASGWFPFEDLGCPPIHLEVLNPWWQEVCKNSEAVRDLILLWTLTPFALWTPEVTLAKEVHFKVSFHLTIASYLNRVPPHSQEERVWSWLYHVTYLHTILPHSWLNQSGQLTQVGSLGSLSWKFYFGPERHWFQAVFWSVAETKACGAAMTQPAEKVCQERGMVWKEGPWLPLPT